MKGPSGWVIMDAVPSLKVLAAWLVTGLAERDVLGVFRAFSSEVALPDCVAGRTIPLTARPDVPFGLMKWSIHFIYLRFLNQHWF
jgi:hypothetical protein